MSDWLVVLSAAVLGGLFTTVLQLRHDRGAVLRNRMLEAADDFIEAYTLAREAAADARREVRVLRSIVEDPDLDVRDERMRGWYEKRDAAVRSATEACEALRHRRPRIGLLFGVTSPADRSAFLAETELTMAIYPVTLEPSDEDGADQAWRNADNYAEAFGRYVRDAILGSPWSVRPLMARGRILRRRLRKRLTREKS